MCYKPILIKNTWRHENKNPYGYLKDITHDYIRVPCGHCEECIANKQMQLVQRVQMEAKKNHMFFCTLTYNNESIPKLVTSTGYEFKYVDTHDLQLLFKRMRNKNTLTRPMRYFAVKERGTKRGRPHAHIIFMIPKEEGDTFNTMLNIEKKAWGEVLQLWAHNIGTDKNPIYRPNCTYKEKWVHGVLKRNYDFHYVNPALSKDGESDVGWYVLKYMLKANDKETKIQQALRLNLSEEEYNATYPLIKSGYIKSQDFGQKKDKDIQQYLHKCVERGKTNSDFPTYYNEATGQKFPLSRFYKDNPKIYNIDDANDYYQRRTNGKGDSSENMPDLWNFTKYETKERQLKKKRKQVESTEDNILF